MKTFHNPDHARHAGRQEMFRGRLVDCHEVPARLDFVMTELQRRPLGTVQTPDLDEAALDAALAQVHSARTREILERDRARCHDRRKRRGIATPQSDLVTLLR